MGKYLSQGFDILMVNCIIIEVDISYETEGDVQDDT